MRVWRSCCYCCCCNRKTECLNKISIDFVCIFRGRHVFFFFSLSMHEMDDSHFIVYFHSSSIQTWLYCYIIYEQFVDGINFTMYSNYVHIFLLEINFKWKNNTMHEWMKMEYVYTRCEQEPNVRYVAWIIMCSHLDSHSCSVCIASLLVFVSVCLTLVCCSIHSVGINVPFAYENTMDFRF